MNVDFDDGESIMTMAYEDHEWPTMNWSWELNELASYALGYKYAADRIVSETNRINAYVVYPVMFLYRHYLEIQLKTHLKAFQEYLGIPRNIPQHHNLLKLWKKVCKLEAEAINQQRWDADDTLANCTEIGNLIRDFHEIDGKSTAFRYPISKSEDTAPKGVPFGYISLSVDLNDVRKRVHDASLPLCGALDKIRIYREYEVDIARDA